jgi:hypothetical protein
MYEPEHQPRPTIEEHGQPPAPTSPVEPGPFPPTFPDARRTGGGRWRWAAALGLVAILLASTLAGAALLTGAHVDSVVSRWAPPDAVGYAELRQDLPGDQRDALGAFLSAFPGFADRSILDQKLADVYDRLVKAATEGRQSWATDIAPWFGGQLGVAVGPLPDPASVTDRQSLGAGTRELWIATTTDPVGALAWVRTTADQAGLAVRSGDANGTTILIIGPAAMPIAAAATGDVLLLGDEPSVRAALGRGGRDGLAAQPRFVEAMGSLPSGPLALAYADTGALIHWAVSLPTRAGATPVPTALADVIPAWVAGSVRVASDALLAESVHPRSSAAPDVPDTASILPTRLPDSTVALAEVHDPGAALSAAMALPMGPEATASITRLEDALKPIGGIDALIGWASEAGVVAIRSGDTVLHGLAAVPSDPAAATALSRSLGNLLALAGVDSTETTVGAVTVETADITNLVKRAGGKTPPSPIVVSWAVTDSIVAVGEGPAFVEAVLAAPSGTTLAATDRFSSAVERVGARQHALAWADIDALTALAVAQMPAAKKAVFQRDVEPYLAPLSVAVAVVVRDGSLDRTRSALLLDAGR